MKIGIIVAMDADELLSFCIVSGYWPFITYVL